MIILSYRQRIPSQLTLFATTVWVLINLNICSAQNTHYVSSATDSACPSTPCLNFSLYIQNLETYFTSNTTFTFSSGNHIVETNVVIANVSALKLIGSKFTVGTATRFYALHLLDLNLKMFLMQRLLH